MGTELDDLCRRCGTRRELDTSPTTLWDVICEECLSRAGLRSDPRDPITSLTLLGLGGYGGMILPWIDFVPRFPCSPLSSLGLAGVRTGILVGLLTGALWSWRRAMWLRLGLWRFCVLPWIAICWTVANAPLPPEYRTAKEFYGIVLCLLWTILVAFFALRQVPLHPIRRAIPAVMVPVLACVAGVAARWAFGGTEAFPWRLELQFSAMSGLFAVVLLPFPLAAKSSSVRG